jgi:hypothetical protein
MTNARNVLLSQIARATFFIAVFTIFASLGAAQAASNLGGGSFGFSCDVNTRQCKCSGIESGADCQAMKQNCTKGVDLNCFRDTEYKPICICNMARIRKQVPSNIAPTLKEMAPQ